MKPILWARATPRAAPGWSPWGLVNAIVPSRWRPRRSRACAAAHRPACRPPASPPSPPVWAPSEAGVEGARPRRLLVEREQEHDREHRRRREGPSPHWRPRTRSANRRTSSSGWRAQRVDREGPMSAAPMAIPTSACVPRPTVAASRCRRRRRRGPVKQRHPDGRSAWAGEGIGLQPAPRRRAIAPIGRLT